MVRAIAVDVRDRLVDGVDELDGNREREVLGRPVRLSRGIAGNDGLHLFGAANGDPLGAKRPSERGQEGRSYAAVHEQRLHGVARRCVLHLGIDHDAHGLLDVSVLVHVDVADAVGMAHDRNLGVVHDVAHEGVGSSGDEKVHESEAVEEEGDVLARLDLVEATLGKAGVDGRRMDDLEEGLVGMEGLRTALEDGAVAALDAERRDLHERVGASLEDDADDADGAALAHEREPLVELAAQEHATHWVGQVDETVDARTDVSELVVVKAQALDDGGGDAVLLGSCEVLGVG